MSDLRCSNPKCLSRVREEGVENTPFFNLNVTVYADRSVAENMRKVPCEEFECGICGAEAEDVPEEACGDCGRVPHDPDGQDATSIADHGRCFDCQKKWQHGEGPEEEE